MLNSLDLEGRPQDTRVVVAMSGGVDSSVTAALLKAEGYDVVGVTLQLYDHGAATHRKGACCAGQDIHDARAVAERIGIPHYVLDYESRFKEAVIDRFAESYVAGETPVPCVDCNQSIKFHDLLDHRARARRRGAGDRPLRRLARRCRTAAARSTAPATRSATRAISCSPPRASSSICCAFRSASATKAETRELARRFGLAVADKHDSQDICFVPTGRYTDVIERLKPGAAEPGDIVDLDGRVLGRHDGIIHFTVGQRRGLGVAAGHAALCGAARRARRAASWSARARRCARAACGCATSTGSATARSTRRSCAGWHEVFVKVRSTRPPQPAWLRARRAAASRSIWSTARTACRPGQACVFYDAADGQARVLGGGFIQSAVARPTRCARRGARTRRRGREVSDRG